MESPENSVTSNANKLPSPDSISFNLYEDDERRWFREAFITEISDDKAKTITFRELVDVIICAGKDITSGDLHQIWPYDTGKTKISYDEAFHIFQQVPKTNFNVLFQLFTANSFSGDFDYEKIITYLEESIIGNDNDKEVSEKKSIIKWLEEKQRKRVNISDMIPCFEKYQIQLREINSKIVKEQNRATSNRGRLFLPKSSSESLSSLFSNNRVNVEGHSGSNTAAPLSGGNCSVANSFRESINDEKTTVKSLVIQSAQNKNSCVAYSFTLFRPQRIRIHLQINEKIDSSLSRFHNHVFGYLIAQDNKIYGVTKRKENGAMCTEWVELPTGTFTFRIKFCRPLKMIEPEKSDEILDSRRLLTKSFRVMLMNLFDMFDLDNDGLLNQVEFELYSILSGSGKMINDKWDKIKQNFELRDNGLSMKTFIKMHQAEADSYKSNTYLQDMWAAVRRLGHNSKFFMSTACPLLIDFQLSEGVLFSQFEIHESTADAETFLVDYFWENSTPLPYLKEFQLLRQFKTDYFAVLLGGKVNEETTYKLDLSLSNSVNIEGNDLIVEQKVPANTTKVLTVAIAQGDSWYLNVKRMQN